MKYIRFKQINKLRKNEDKLYLNSLDINERKKIKRDRFFINFFINLAIILFFVIMFIFVYLFKLIPVPENVLLRVLFYIAFIIVIFIVCIIDGLIVGMPFSKIINKFNYEKHIPKKKDISKVCEVVRDYYGLKEEYLITKCFDCTNKKFIDHDVCIFRYNDEIRITANIIQGFINDGRDLGCYCFKINEFQLYKEDYNGCRVSILSTEKIKFILGIKAYSFINRLIMENEQDEIQ